MDWIFFVKNRIWWITHGGIGILRTPPNWKKASELCAAFCYQCLHSLLALYIAYKQVKHYGRQQWQTLPGHSCIVTAEEKQEMFQRFEALERTMDSLDALAGHLAELARQVVDLQQEAYRCTEALEGSLSGPDVSEERLAELASQMADLQQETHRRLEVLEGSLSRSGTSEERLSKLENHVTHLQRQTYQRIETLEEARQNLDASSEERLVKLEDSITNLQQEVQQRMEVLEGALQGLTELESQITCLQQSSQALNLSKSAVAAQEERKPILLTARGFAARHGVDWNQMQTWIDTQVLTPALSPEGLPDYLLTSDQQSMLIRYWKSCKISYTPCVRCPHYVLFGP